MAAKKKSSKISRTSGAKKRSGKKTTAAARRPQKRTIGAKRAASTRAKKKSRPTTARGATRGGHSLRDFVVRLLEASAGADEDAILALYADDVESIEANMPATIGTDALRAKYAGWRNAVSSTDLKPQNVWVDGNTNTVLIEWVGPCVLAGSGKQIELREIAVHEIEDGKIVRERYYYDPSVFQG